MTMLQSVFKIEDDSKKDALLEIVSDKYCRSILGCVMDKPKSAIEITAETNIPLSTIYRRIQILCDSKLLAVSGALSEDGKKFFLYKNKIKSINTGFSEGKIDVEIVLL